MITYRYSIGAVGGIEDSANYIFCKELYQWTFQQRGVLKLSNMRHHKVIISLS